MASKIDQQYKGKTIKELTSPTLKDIKDAAKHIASKAIRTPLVRLNYNTVNKTQLDHEVCNYAS